MEGLAVALLNKGQSRDIWSTPPGGLAPAAGRSHLKSAIAFVVVAALSIGGSLMYASMKKSTAVSAEDALAEFAAANGIDDEPAKRQPAKARATRGKQRSRTIEARRGQAKERIAAAPSSSDARPARGSSRPAAAPAGSAAPNNRPKPASSTGVAPPEDGVYAWSVDGYEQAPGIRRDLPSRSHRVITHEGKDAWSEHHIFSEEREQWMNLSVSPEGVMARSVRNRVEMGPVEVDNTVVFDPVMFVARYPSKVGQTWRGSWSGDTSGSYTARTFEKTTVVIEGEPIEVYASEVVMDMRGEVEGRVITRSWYSLQHRMVVKQYQKLDVTSRPGDYRSEWTGQVLSLQPQK